MADEATRRYAAAAARASMGYAPGFTAYRPVPNGRGGWMMQRTYNPPSRDMRSELQRWSDARQAMGTGRPGDGRVYLDVISRALQSAANNVGRNVRMAATGSSGQYRGRNTATRVNQTQPRRTAAKKATAKKATAKKATAKKAATKRSTTRRPRNAR